jgi:hypothetical protein
VERVRQTPFAHFIARPNLVCHCQPGCHRRSRAMRTPLGPATPSS